MDLAEFFSDIEPVGQSIFPKQGAFFWLPIMPAMLISPYSDVGLVDVFGI
jgi:hypothetical protein